MNVAQSVFLFFKNRRYSVDMLLKQAGPNIEITKNDIHPDSAKLVQSSAEVPKQPLVVAAYEGKYVVLTGDPEAFPADATTVFKAKLISNPTLKRAIG